MESRLDFGFGSCWIGADGWLRCNAFGDNQLSNGKVRRRVLFMDLKWVGANLRVLVAPPRSSQPIGILQRIPRAGPSDLDDLSFTPIHTTDKRRPIEKIRQDM